MVTLTLGDLIVVFLLNLTLSVLVAYVINYVKRKAELTVEESSGDKEYLKKVIRDTVSETRTVLTELRVQEFNVRTGKRRLSRMNTLVEKISLADPKLGTKFWNLVNAPVFIDTINKTYEGVSSDPEVTKYRNSIIDAYLKDIDWALDRCADIEKNPSRWLKNKKTIKKVR